MILYPVILPVIEDVEKLPRKGTGDLLSRVARQALKLSADKSGIALGELSKNEDNAPLPFGSHHWSVSHKPKYVTAVVSDARIGIDIEEIKPRTESLFGYVASEDEWALSDGKSWDAFFRYWTAKEAVVKAVGLGLAELKACKIISIPDENHVLLDYRDHLYRIAQLRYNNHIASVLKDGNEVTWLTPEALGLSGHKISLMI